MNEKRRCIIFKNYNYNFEKFNIYLLRFLSLLESFVKLKDLPVIGTSEAILWASSLGTMNRILITVVATIIVTVAEPVRLDANVRLFAFEVIQGACSVARTTLVCLIRSNVVLAVIDAVAHLRLRNAAIVGTGEFTWRTGRINASFFVATVPTVILVIAFPRFEDTSAVIATELVRTTRMVS